ncbi:MAG: von Willebrand factor type A domain-containing protein [Victivallales bacterium]|nr:von Willebrand factor type A domain-containing protein [Victivallales bacterium]
MEMKQDPRITAYVAGELSEEEKVRFETEMKENEALRDEVERVRKFVTETLSKHDLDGKVPVLGPDAMMEEVLRRERIARLKRRILWRAIAAVAVVALMVTVIRLGNPQEQKEVAFTPTQLIGQDAKSAAVNQTDGAVSNVEAEAVDRNMIVAEKVQEKKKSFEVLGSSIARKSKMAMEPPRLYKPAPPRKPVPEPPVQYLPPPDVRAGERYQQFRENQFLAVTENPLSTFSLDVDTASWANIRRYITQNHRLPPADAVRLEEMLNYFRYSWKGPSDNAPFALHPGLTECPWNPEHRLLRLAVKAREPEGPRPPVNLVLLVDVSGSMYSENKLPLLKRAMRMLAENFREQDSISLVTYANGTRVVLDGVPGTEQGTIFRELDELQAAGGTYGEGGIQLAYQTALKHFKRDGVNRVILGTDGDFNVGISDLGELSRFIAKQAKTGVFLSIMGFGMGNYHDSTLKRLSSDGNGNYGYIDTINEARKLLVEQLDSTLVTVAKDVKVQVEFNPAQVAGYRLLGYENRVLAKEDFNDDKKDAGEVGAGHCVTVLYEIVPAGQEVPATKVDALKYQKNTPAGEADELATIKIRYKEPKEDTSKLLQFPALQNKLFQPFAKADEELRFAATVASFGLVLRNSQFKGSATIESTLRLAEQTIPDNAASERKEFLSIVRQATALK